MPPTLRNGVPQPPPPCAPSEDGATPGEPADWVNRDGLTTGEGKRRILLTLSYEGTAYAGWQRQINGVAVQQRVEEALHTLTGEHAGITGASRTDAGVHALGQRAHFDTASRIPAERFPYALNTCLPRDIRVLEGCEVGGSFHARFDAKGKQYAYRIHNAPHASALQRNLTAHVPVPLDVPAMRRALGTLPGTHDFAAFQASGGTAKTTVRTLQTAELAQVEDEITLTVRGDAFLYNMVRIIAGTLIEVGKGKLAEDCFTRALQTGDRLALGPTAPACGLTLARVYYAGDAWPTR
ncbi:MAG: tRNA pseudouridine(38-40) synthase TruA [Eubacteriales bacterium]|nr:tRNA pseudouridine(38-40) synthase TruA [Eubacteriales bacterium]